MPEAPFVHLHCHSDYSLLDGACDIPRLIRKVAEMGMPAVALTDHGNLFGAVQFYHAAKDAGIHPVIGCEVYVSQQGRKVRSDTDRYNHLVLLCGNQEGYRNLIQLASTAFLEGFYYKPRIDKELLARYAKGLIGLSACLRGEINETLAADRYEEGKRLAYTFTSRCRTTAWSPTAPWCRPWCGFRGRRASPWWPPTTRITSAERTPARTRSCCASRRARP